MIPVLVALTLGYGGTDLTFIRHGETQANQSGVYSSKTLNEFSVKGKAEVAALTAQLITLPKFDLILVSPSPRAMKTIDPYLRRTRQRAMVWPLLYECCTGRRPKDAKPTTFGFGPKVVVPHGMEGEFALMRNEQKLPVASTYNSGLAQVKASVAEFQRFFRGRRVLLVGHSGHGGHFLHELTGKWKKLDNAKIEHFSLP